MISFFISHDPRDRAFARRVATDLGAIGALVWWEETDLAVGENVGARVQATIAAMDMFVVVLSPASAESSRVATELSQALAQETERQRPKILPAMLADCSLPEVFAALSHRATADFRDDTAYGASLLRLARSAGLDAGAPGNWRPTVCDPLAERGGRIGTHYARPKLWHCLFCGWRCEETFNDYICKRCSALRPFAGGSATMRRCLSCGGFNLALARFCEWCGQEFAALQ